MDGYMGKILSVDLTKGELQDEVLDDKLCQDFGAFGFIPLGQLISLFG